MQKQIKNTTTVSVSAVNSSNLSSWHSASGPVDIPMTNDYLFRVLMQKNNKVLKGLICSLLHMSSEDISSAIISNPIELGKSIDDKTFMLDIKVFLNKSTFINLEMQVVNKYDWPERSLSYLCRNFDKLRFSVLDLTHIDLATKEDKLYQIDYWAALFKSTTWEEIRMLAQNNEYIEEAAATIYQVSQEENIRLQCEAREDYYRQQKDMEWMIENLTAEYEKLLAWAKAHGYE